MKIKILFMTGIFLLINSAFSASGLVDPSSNVAGKLLRNKAIAQRADGTNQIPRLSANTSCNGGVTSDYAVATNYITCASAMEQTAQSAQVDSFADSTATSTSTSTSTAVSSFSTTEMTFESAARAF